MGAGCSKATINVREILNVAICKDWDVNVVTVNNEQQSVETASSHNNKQTKHSVLDIS